MSTQYKHSVKPHAQKSLQILWYQLDQHIHAMSTLNEKVLETKDQRTMHQCINLASTLTDRSTRPDTYKNPATSKSAHKFSVSKVTGFYCGASAADKRVLPLYQVCTSSSCKHD